MSATGRTTGTRSLRVGTLARAAGLTVRTLHHWDHLGLVQPSERTPAGHRLYSPADVDRLYAVVALRQLGLPLETIGAAVAGELSLTEVLAVHVEHLDAQLVALRTLRAQVSTVLATPESGRPADDVLELIRKVTEMDEMTKAYFSPEQLAVLAERREQAGEGALADVAEQWPALMRRVDDAVARGLDPGSEEAQTLAGEWEELLAAFHGGDDGLRDSLFRMQSDNAEQIEREHGGPSPAQLEFIGAAQAARG